MTDEIQLAPRRTITLSSEALPHCPHIMGAIWTLLCYRDRMVGIEIRNNRRVAVIQRGEQFFDDEIATRMGFDRNTARAHRYRLREGGYVACDLDADPHRLFLTELALPFWQFWELDPAPLSGEFRIPVKTALLSHGHWVKMGNAVWAFLWLIDATTHTIGWPWFVGSIHYDNAVKLSRIADDLRRSERTIAGWLDRLQSFDYTLDKDTPEGRRLWLQKSIKWGGRKSRIQLEYEARYREMVAMMNLPVPARLALTADQLRDRGWPEATGSPEVVASIIAEDGAKLDGLQAATRSRMAQPKSLTDGRFVDRQELAVTEQESAVTEQESALTCQESALTCQESALTCQEFAPDAQKNPRNTKTPNNLDDAPKIDLALYLALPSNTDKNIHGFHLSADPLESFPAKDAGKRETICRVWKYYLEKLNKPPKILELTEGRLKKGLARLDEALVKVGGDLGKAEELMEMAVDALASSAWHTGGNPQKTRYDSWEKNLFSSQERFERWLDVANG